MMKMKHMLSNQLSNQMKNPKLSDIMALPFAPNSSILLENGKVEKLNQPNGDRLPILPGVDHQSIIDYNSSQLSVSRKKPIKNNLIPHTLHMNRAQKDEYIRNEVEELHGGPHADMGNLNIKDHIKAGYGIQI
jgi:hypothetical protein